GVSVGAGLGVSVGVSLGTGVSVGTSVWVGVRVMVGGSGGRVGKSAKEVTGSAFCQTSMARIAVKIMKTPVSQETMLDWRSIMTDSMTAGRSRSNGSGAGDTAAGVGATGSGTAGVAGPSAATSSGLASGAGVTAASA